MKYLKKLSAFVLILSLICTSLYIGKHVYADIDQESQYVDPTITDLVLSWSNSTDSTMQINQGKVAVSAELTATIGRATNAGDVQIKLPKAVFNSNTDTIEASVSLPEDESSDTGFHYLVDSDSLIITNYKEIEENYELHVDIEYSAEEANEGTYVLHATCDDVTSPKLTVEVGDSEEPTGSPLKTREVTPSFPVSISLSSVPYGLSQEYPGECLVGDTIEFNIRVTNTDPDNGATDLDTVLEIPDGLTPLMDTAKYYFDTDKSSAKAIAGSSGYTATKMRSEVRFQADSMEAGEQLNFLIECQAEPKAQTVTTQAIVLNVNNISSDEFVYSNEVYHSIYFNGARFEVINEVNSSYWVDTEKEFSYTAKFSWGGNPYEGDLDYKVMYGDTEEGSGKISVTGGNATFKLKTNRKLVIPRMPAEMHYEISQDDLEGYSPEKDMYTGETLMKAASITFKNNFNYKPVLFSFNTNIVAAMQGRPFQNGDSFTYKITPESTDFPIVKGYEDGEDGTKILVTKNTFTVNPTSGHTCPINLGEDIVSDYGIHCKGCDQWFYSRQEYSDHNINTGCWGSYEVARHNFNQAPQIKLCYPGTYQYLVEQIEPESGIGHVSYDPMVYRLTVNVTETSDGQLEASLRSVRKKLPSSQTWSVVSDKSHLVFTNYYEGDDADSSIQAEVELLGQDLKGSDFEYILEPAGCRYAGSNEEFFDMENQPLPNITTVTNSKQGTILFNNINFTEDMITNSDYEQGMEIRYRLRQKQPTTNGKFPESTEEFEQIKLPGTTIKNGSLVKDHIMYDNNIHYLIIGLNAYLENDVKVINISLPDKVVKFSNKFITEGTIAGSDLKVTKVVQDKQWTTGTFSYTLTGNDAATRNAIEDGRITLKKDTLNLSSSAKTGTFGDIELLTTGTFSFKVKEGAGGHTGFSTDSTPRIINVVATDNNNDGELEIEVTGNSVDELTFVSEYAPIEYEFINKVKVPVKLTGRDLTNSDEFVCSLTGADDKTRAAIEGGSVILESDTLSLTKDDLNKDGNMEASIPKITFYKDGVYKFYISCSTDAQGVTAVCNTCGFDVTIEDVGGTLTLSTLVEPSSIPLVFNYYAQGVFSANEYQAQIDLNGREWFEGDSFPVTLEGNNDVTNQAIADGDIVYQGGSFPAMVSVTSREPFVFDDILFKKPGNYSFKMYQTMDDEMGLTIDRTVRVIDVNASDVNNNGSLSIVANGNSLSRLTFNNIYQTQGTVTEDGLAVRSVLQGKDWEDEEFSYILEASDEDTIRSILNGEVTLGRATLKTNAESKTGNFGNITIRKPGTYTFTVRQEVTEEKKGMSYDSSPRTITILAMDNTVGGMFFEIEGTDQLVFTNVYSEVGVLSGIHVQENIKGREWVDGDKFRVTLEAGDSDTQDAIDSGKIQLPDVTELEITNNTSNKQGTFGTMFFNERGEYVFKIRHEYIGDNNLSSIDSVERVINVSVTSEGGGVLDANASGTSLEELTFNNSYSISKHFDGVPVGIKIEGRELQPEDTFELHVSVDSDKAKNLEEVITASSDEVTVGAFDATEAGIYTLTISQAAGDADGLIYDDKEIIVKVRVTDDYRGNVTTEVLEGYTKEFFTNIFSTSTAVSGIEVKKTLEGRDWLESDEFTFAMFSDNDKTADQVNKGKIVLPENVVISKSSEDHKGNFGNLVFTEPGEFSFAIQEVNSGEQGIYYDADKRIVNVTVTKDASTGNLTATYDKNSYNKVFTNKYTATGTLIGSSNLRVQVLGESGSNIVIEPVDNYGDAVEMPKSTKINMQDNDVKSFGNIKFHKTGEYKFTISQVDGSNPNADYDAVEHEITVTVADNGDGTLRVESSPTGIFTFNNVLKMASMDIEVVVEDEDGNPLDDTFVMTASLIDQNGKALEGNFPVQKSGEDYGFITNGGSLIVANGDRLHVSDVPVGTRFSYRLEVKDGFEYGYVGSDGVLGKDGATGIKLSATKINSEPIENYGSLTISSSVIGGDIPVEFVITFDSDKEFNYTGSKDGTLHSGDVIELSNGESITITGIPAGTSYKVSTRKGNYETQASNAEGSIDAYSAVFAEFVSIIKEEPEEKFGNLQINGLVNGYKEVYGDIAEVTVKLQDKEGNTLKGEYEYDGEESGKISGEKTFAVNGGSFSITVKNLPDGSKYTVELNNKEFKGGYISKWNLVNGENSIEANETAGVSFNLEVKEDEVVPPEDKVSTLGINASIKDFTDSVPATLNLYDKDGNVLSGEFESTVGAVSSGATLTLVDGTSIAIKGLPVGTQWNLQVPESEKYNLHISNASGKLGEEPARIMVSIQGTGAEPPEVVDAVAHVRVNANGYTGGVSSLVMINKGGSSAVEEFSYTGTHEGTLSNGYELFLLDGMDIQVNGLTSDLNFDLAIENGRDYSVSKQRTATVNESGIYETNIVITITPIKEPENSEEPVNPEEPPQGGNQGSQGGQVENSGDSGQAVNGVGSSIQGISQEGGGKVGNLLQTGENYFVGLSVVLIILALVLRIVQSRRRRP